jgi:hypothetical protein
LTAAQMNRAPTTAAGRTTTSRMAMIAAAVFMA